MSKTLKIASVVITVVLAIVFGVCTFFYTHQYEWVDNVRIDDALAMIENDEDAILYFGYSTCPWCQDAEPAIKDVAEEGRLKVNYVPIKTESGEYLLTNEQRQKISEIMADQEKYVDYWEEATDEDKENENAIVKEDKVFKFYVPTVLVVKGGEIESVHCGTLDEHDIENDMSDEEKEELRDIYREMFKSVSWFLW